ncbi:MAG: B12-binding domain-containing radical SAM protein [Clostridia bacterium]|nr:B12-binding domain-containing radical SAM protein [Clostridia bacterium]
MKIILVGINSKYSHSCLAIRYLKAFCKRDDVTLQEYTINEKVSDVAASIYKSCPDVVLFSCYIWNIRFVLSVADCLRKVLKCKIILGGPEVTYDAQTILKENPYIDAIIMGEGELTFKELLDNNFEPETVLSMVYRKNEKIITNQSRPLICDLNILPFPYTDEDMKTLKDKLIYYEGSRGCPFRCSYCMSSTMHSVRFFDIERVKKDLLFFIGHKVRIVKFVDRTFNINSERTYELFRFLIENVGETVFHFEIAADLITDDILQLLKCAPKGLFQFEIGVQSTNPKTLEAIDRKNDLEKIKKAVTSILKLNNIHIHLDLIAGLPHENLESFRHSFDEVFELRPHVLQLGFLKMLKGTKIYEQKEMFAYKYTTLPPYEILCNQFLSYADILVLKSVEAVFERYYNSGAFKTSIECLLRQYSSPFEMFVAISAFFERNGYDKASHSQKILYKILYDFYRENFEDDVFVDYLKFDYFNINKGVTTPEWSLIPYDKTLLCFRFDFLRKEENVQKYLPEYMGMAVKDMIKHLHFERFCYDVVEDGQNRQNIIIFDYLYGRNVKIEEIP